jgi:hypothetical protein
MNEPGLQPLRMAFAALSAAIGQDAALALVQIELGYPTLAQVPPAQRGELACELIERAR